MMTRRGFISALCALPFIGRLAKSIAAPQSAEGFRCVNGATHTFTVTPDMWDICYRRDAFGNIVESAIMDPIPYPKGRTPVIWNGHRWRAEGSMIHWEKL